MISLKDISKSFKNKVILKDINLTILEKEKVVFVGKNGAGKSTLLKIIAGEIDPDGGKIEKPESIKIEYFPQEIPESEREKTGKEYLSEKLNIDQNRIFGVVGGLFKKLQFDPKKLDQKIEELSGGQRSKILLMLILKSQADVFLLDEPTNNLDLRGLVLLDDFISSSKKGFFIVSHDRKILDRFVNGIIKMNEETHSAEKYSYSYTRYLEEMRLKEEKEQEEYQEYIKEKGRLEEAIQIKKKEAYQMESGPEKLRDKDKRTAKFKKNRSKKVASQASSIEKRLEKLEEIECPQKSIPMGLKFSLAEKSGDIVFRLKKVEAGYDKFLIGPLNLEINSADRVVILGPNGEGKSTLTKILLKKIEAKEGIVYFGSNIKEGYLPQEVSFNPEERLLDFFMREAKTDERGAYHVLSKLGFSEDKVYSKIGKISPGQRSRIILAMLMTHPVNCLVLDEPSNHLDSEAMECLQEALKSFKGTIVIVSHDRYFIDQVGVNKTFLVENKTIIPLKDYHEYEKIVAS